MSMSRSLRSCVGSKGVVLGSWDTVGIAMMLTRKRKGRACFPDVLITVDSSGS